jgi:hypothetical protein
MFPAMTYGKVMRTPFERFPWEVDEPSHGDIEQHFPGFYGN